MRHTAFGCLLCLASCGDGDVEIDLAGAEHSAAIVGGQDSVAADWPFAVALYYLGSTDSEGGPGFEQSSNCYTAAGEEYCALCSGALIAPNKVLTARHCVQEPGQALRGNMRYYVGQANPDAGTPFLEHLAIDIEYPVESAALDGDIAVVTLAGGVPNRRSLWRLATSCGHPKR